MAKPRKSTIPDLHTITIRTSEPLWALPIDDLRVAFLAQGINEHVGLAELFGAILQAGLGFGRAFVAYPFNVMPHDPLVVVALGRYAARAALGVESDVKFGRHSWGQWLVVGGRRTLVCPSLLDMLDDKGARALAWKGLKIIPGILARHDRRDVSKGAQGQ